MNYLRPDLKHGNFTPEEEEEIIRQHRLLGNRWAKLASKLPGRTDNDIKNYWNTHLKKRSRALDGYGLATSQSPDSGNKSDYSEGTLASESCRQDGNCSSHDQSVIPEFSLDVSTVEMDSIFSQLSPLRNQDISPGRQFLGAANWCSCPDDDVLSFFGQ